MATTKSKPFRTLLDPPVEIESVTGEELEEVISMKIGDNGEEDFYISGKTNVYQKTQADKENTVIENIIAKVIATGDTSILTKAQGQYTDLTEVPKTIFEAQQKIKEAEKTFEELPIEIRSEYNNNFNEYLKDVGTNHWLETVGLKEKATPEVKVEEKGAEE